MREGFEVELAWREAKRRGFDTERLPKSAWVFGACYLVLGYTNPLLFFRGLIGMGDGVGSTVATVLMLLAIVAGIRLIRVTRVKPISRSTVALILFFTYSCINFLFAGVKQTYLLLMAPTMVLSYFALVLLPARGFSRYFSALLAIGLCANAVAVFVAPNYLADASDPTLGTLGDTSFGFFGGRRAGLLAIPGLASVHAVIGLAVCLAWIIEERRWYWAAGAAASVVLGLGTGNRSFVVGATIACALFPFFYIRKLGRGMSALVLTVLLLGVASYAWLKTGYGELMTSRFDNATMDVDLTSRTVGEAGPLPALRVALYSPWYGASVGIPEGGLIVFNGVEWVRPHLGWVFVMATRGVPAAAFLLLWHIFGFWGLVRHRKHEVELLGSRSAAGWSIAFIAAQVVSLTDPMLELAPMFFAVRLGTLLLEAARSEDAKSEHNSLRARCGQRCPDR